MTGKTKSSATSLTPMTKAGQGWTYDNPNITYDGTTDPDGRKVFYNSVGSAITMTGQTKSSGPTLTPLTKNAA